MAQWVAFTAFVTLLTAAMVGLSLLTQRSLTPIRSDSAADSATARDGAAHTGAQSTADPSPSSGTANASSGARADVGSPRRPPSEAAEDGTTEADRRTSDAGSSDRRFDTESNRRADDANSNRRDPEARSDWRSADRRGVRPDEPGSPGRRSGPPSQGAGRVVASVGGEPVTTRGLLVNVTITQALFLGLVIVALVGAEVPIAVLGIEVSRPAFGSGLALGLGAGLGLYGASEVGGELGRRFGVDHDEWLRESLAPSSPRGWVVLFAGVLPLIAVFEEVLFRGVLIGALSAGFGLSPWLLAVVSSVLFAVGHGIQGTAGIVVTGVIGFVLAAVFVVTGNLLTVVVAHYVLNACEFAVHEGLDIEPPGSIRGD